MTSTQEPNPVEALDELIINIYSPLQSASGEIFPFSVGERVKGHRLLPMEVSFSKHVLDLSTGGTPKRLGSPPVDRDRLNAYPGSNI
ncbi:hypothetical protein TNCV_162621 [Trichonephila clavipes]|nr:hypothetical protein TNCV_162621 [Trichonephila clavipes]